MKTILKSMLLLCLPVALASAQTAPTDVVVTVGETPITEQQVNDQMQRLGAPADPQQRNDIRQKIIQEMIYMELLKSYLDEQNVAFTPEDLAEARKRLEKVAQQQGMTVEALMEKLGFTQKDLETQARQRHLLVETTSDKKAQAYMKEHPHFFDDTEVTASHILIKSYPMAPTAEQKQAVETLQKLKADIAASKTTFAEAAQAHSACPSKQNGGSLGSFPFTKMVPPFSVAAFSTKPGELTDIVRTRFGFHLIRVDDRKEGNGKAKPNSMNIAKHVMVSRLQNDLYAQALGQAPIVVGPASNDQAKTEDKPAPATQPEGE